jgi:hypothetical protein
MGRLFIKDDIISLGAEVVLLALTTLSTMLWSLWHSGIGIEHIDRAEGTLAIFPKSIVCEHQGSSGTTIHYLGLRGKNALNL